MSQSSPFADQPPPKPGAIPYANFQPELEPVLPQFPRAIPGMAYWESLNYIFRNPNWMSNVAWGSLAAISHMLIPMAGPLIFMGYQFRSMDGLIRTQGDVYPDFNWDDIEDYLMRGLWAMIVYMLCAIVVGPVVGGIFYCGMFGVVVALASGGEQGPNELSVAGVIVIGVLGILGIFAITLLMSLIVAPLMLRAGLGKDFKRAFDFQWVWDFAGRMWVEMFYAALFSLLLVIPMWLLAIVTCGLGAIPAAIILQMAQTHLWSQWYLLYLQRGGQPILLTVKRNRMAAPVQNTAPGFDPPQKF